jgi:hypothetical protein
VGAAEQIGTRAEMDFLNQKILLININQFYFDLEVVGSVILNKTSQISNNHLQHYIILGRTAHRILVMGELASGRQALMAGMLDLMAGMLDT